MANYRRTIFLFIVAISASLPIAADEDLPPRDLSNLIGTQRQVSFNVSDYRDDRGRRWIRLSSEFEGAYRAKMDDVLETLWDFKDSPRIFPRIESVRVRSDDGTEAITEQRTGVHILGFSYVTNLVLYDQLCRDGKTASLKFESIEVDDTTLSSKGTWFLEDRSDSSGCATYVRYSFESIVAPRFPAQAAIMRQFGADDVRALLRQLGEATDKRTKKS